LSTRGGRSPVIEVRGLRKSFRPQTGWRDLLHWRRKKLVLAGVDLSIFPGEIFGLLGPNGAGKTTLIKILCGLVLPDAGTVHVNGHDVRANSREVRRSIGAIYGEERSFYWRLSVRDNLRFFAGLHGLGRKEADRRIDDLLDVVDLRHAAKVRMYALSSGMKQRAAIARGLLHDPEIVFLDEPTRSLDPLGAEDLHGLIRERVATRGRTVLIATHVMTEAESLCDRLALIDHGVTALAGTVGDFRAHVGHDLIYRLLLTGGSEGWAEHLAMVPGIRSLSIADGAGHKQVQLTVSRQRSVLPAVIRSLVRDSVEVESCERQDAPLEELFRQVVRERRAQRLEAVAR
jgi:ABC-2 type transport system ATP-binding protein